MDQNAYEGGCLCGETRWRASGPPRHRLICHCRSCARAAGANGVPWATFDRTAFEFQGREPAQYASSPPVRRTFCSRCGTTLTYFHEKRPGDIDVATATLDDPTRIEPLGHIWMDDALPWEVRAHELPRHRRFSAGGDG